MSRASRTFKSRTFNCQKFFQVFPKFFENLPIVRKSVHNLLFIHTVKECDSISRSTLTKLFECSQLLHVAADGTNLTDSGRRPFVTENTWWRTMSDNGLSNHTRFWHTLQDCSSWERRNLATIPKLLSTSERCTVHCKYKKRLSPYGN